MPRTRPAMLLALLAAAALAGCGEEEPAATSSASFIADGDEICREAQQRVATLRSEAIETPDQAAKLTRGVIAAYEEEIASLRELQAPPDLSEAMTRYLTAREQGLEPLRDGLAAAEKGDAGAYAEAQAEAADGQLERTRLAEGVGFSECSSPGGAASAAG